MNDIRCHQLLLNSISGIISKLFSEPINSLSRRILCLIMHFAPWKSVALSRSSRLCSNSVADWYFHMLFCFGKASVVWNMCFKLLWYTDFLTVFNERFITLIRKSVKILKLWNGKPHDLFIDSGCRVIVHYQPGDGAEYYLAHTWTFYIGWSCNNNDEMMMMTLMIIIENSYHYQCSFALQLSKMVSCVVTMLKHVASH